MEFYGDPIPFQFFASSRILCRNMSTAIARIYTSEGFAIAADGRGHHGTDKTVATDSAQKIFTISTPDKSLAYAIAGTARLTLGEQTFDFVSEIAKSIQTTDTSSAATLSEFVRMLCIPMEAELRSINVYPTDTPLPESQSMYAIAYVFFDGYYRGIPARVTAAFAHENQALQPTDIVPCDLMEDYLLGYGSRVISESLFGNSTDWLAKYRVTPQRPDRLTLAEATARATGYVAACSDPRALELDKERCAFIGGHIHAATITKSDGFRWVIEPVNNCK
jgi:hypothetical protein